MIQCYKHGAVTSCAVNSPLGPSRPCLPVPLWGAAAHTSSVSLCPGGLGRGSRGGDLAVLLTLRCRCVRCGCGRRVLPAVLHLGPGPGSPAAGRLRSPQGAGRARLLPSRWARVLRELLALPQASVACGTRSLPGSKHKIAPGVCTSSNKGSPSREKTSIGSGEAAYWTMLHVGT